MLNKVKDLLSGEATKSEDIQENQEEVKLEQQSLVNGTVLEAESFESGKEVFIVTEDEKVALPLGDYELEDGRILKVEEEGMIASIGEVSEVESEEEAKEEEVEATEEAPVKKKIVSEITEEVYASKEELNELSSKIEELKTLLEKKADIQEKEELAEEPVKIKHSPEANSKKDLNFFKPRGSENSFDRVLANMAKYRK